LKNKKSKNRKPTSKESDIGSMYLTDLVDLFEKKLGYDLQIKCIGKVSYNKIKKMWEEREIEYIRHPSFAGKSDFLNAMNRLFNRKDRKFTKKKLDSFF
jgi:hypothetical protein